MVASREGESSKELYRHCHLLNARSFLLIHSGNFAIETSVSREGLEGIIAAFSSSLAYLSIFFQFFIF